MSTDMVHVESSNIDSVGHDASGTLRIQMKDGRCYTYLGVPAPVYARLLDAASIGSFVNREVRGQYARQIDRCPECQGAGWVLDAKLHLSPTTLELIPCIYPPCESSRRQVAVLCLYGEWDSPVLHPSTGAVMSLSQRKPSAANPSHWGRRVTSTNERTTSE